MLLAKYLEHQAVAMLREFDNQCPPRTQIHPLSPGHERVANGGVVTRDTAYKSIDTNNYETPPRLRVLELGCGTGLAGLAAAFSFGRRHPGLGGDGGEGKAALPIPPRHHHPFKGQDKEITNCASAGEGGVEVVLTDLEYALTNARANISRNTKSLKAVGSRVKVAELDWCRPLPMEVVGEMMCDAIVEFVAGSREF